MHSFNWGEYRTTYSRDVSWLSISSERRSVLGKQINVELVFARHRIDTLPAVSSPVKTPKVFSR